ncbi:MAG: PIN-like domain-containing protein [Candidatus Nanopelagicaceae bacterium]|nr:PIN-like domain-containing protein [Candidatus Nanopelagicaceae bacterium]
MIDRGLEDRILKSLSWEGDLASLDSLQYALKGGARTLQISLDTAICFDSNVFLRIAGGQNAAELIDYLDNKHTGPLLLPSQVILEFWNNQGTFIDEYGTRILSKFDELYKLVGEIGEEYSEFRDGAKKLVSDFKENFGHVFLSQTRPSLLIFFEVLQRKSIISQVRRESFSALAASRQATKTPPGFLDEGDGDFYVWVEFLLGLLIAKKQKKTFNEALLVTNDVKRDWSTKGIPHPILTAELFQLVGVPFRVMDLDEFGKAVKTLIRNDPHNAVI